MTSWAVESCGRCAENKKPILIAQDAHAAIEKFEYEWVGLAFNVWRQITIEGCRRARRRNRYTIGPEVHLWGTCIYAADDEPPRGSAQQTDKESINQYIRKTRPTLTTRRWSCDRWQMFHAVESLDIRILQNCTKFQRTHLTLIYSCSLTCSYQSSASLYVRVRAAGWFMFRDFEIWPFYDGRQLLSNHKSSIILSAARWRFTQQQQL
jgi:hypothetical protein